MEVWNSMFALAEIHFDDDAVKAGNDRHGFISFALHYKIKQFDRTRPKHRCRAGLSSSGPSHEKFNALVADKPIGIDPTGAEVFCFQPGIAFEAGFWRIASCQHAEYQ